MNKEEMICIAGEDGIVKPLPQSKAFTKFEDIKKYFGYKDTDPTVYRSKTLNEQFNDWIEELKRETAKQIFVDIDNRLHDMALEYYNAGHHEYFAVCEMVHHKVLAPVEKKYTGEGI